MMMMMKKKKKIRLSKENPAAPAKGAGKMGEDAPGNGREPDRKCERRFRAWKHPVHVEYLNMTVKQLKQQLDMRELSKSGLKDDLLDRLLLAVEGEKTLEDDDDMKPSPNKEDEDEEEVTPSGTDESKPLVRTRCARDVCGKPTDVLYNKVHAGQLARFTCAFCGVRLPRSVSSLLSVRASFTDDRRKRFRFVYASPLLPAGAENRIQLPNFARRTDTDESKPLVRARCAREVCGKPMDVRYNEVDAGRSRQFTCVFCGTYAPRSVASLLSVRALFIHRRIGVNAFVSFTHHLSSLQARRIGSSCLISRGGPAINGDRCSADCTPNIPNIQPNVLVTPLALGH